MRRRRKVVCFYESGCAVCLPLDCIHIIMNFIYSTFLAIKTRDIVNAHMPRMTHITRAHQNKAQKSSACENNILVKLNNFFAALICSLCPLAGAVLDRSKSTFKTSCGGV